MCVCVYLYIKLHIIHVCSNHLQVLPHHPRLDIDIVPRSTPRQYQVGGSGYFARFQWFINIKTNPLPWPIASRADHLVHTTCYNMSRPCSSCVRTMVFFAERTGSCESLIAFSL